MLQLKIQLDDQSNELITLRKQNDQLKHQMEDQCRSIQEKDGELTLLSNKLDSVSRDNNELLQELEQKDDDLDFMQADMEEMSNQLTQLKKLEQETVPEIQKQLEDLRQEHQQATLCLSSKEAEEVIAPSFTIFVLLIIVLQLKIVGANEEMAKKLNVAEAEIEELVKAPLATSEITLIWMYNL